jgi:hypothetical protein
LAERGRGNLPIFENRATNEAAPHLGGNMTHPTLKRRVVI